MQQSLYNPESTGAIDASVLALGFVSRSGPGTIIWVYNWLCSISVNYCFNDWINYSYSVNYICSWCSGYIIKGISIGSNLTSSSYWSSSISRSGTSITINSYDPVNSVGRGLDARGTESAARDARVRPDVCVRPLWSIPSSFPSGSYTLYRCIFTSHRVPSPSFPLLSSISISSRDGNRERNISRSTTTSSISSRE